MNKTKIIIFLLLLFNSYLSWCYPNYIGHGYTSCLNCHFNPFGNGPVNDYGRAVSATLISARWPYPKTWSEETLAEKSGFLFRKPKQDWFRTQLNYRRFQLTRNPGGKNETQDWITMQADARAIVKFGQNDKFIAVFNHGYAPPPMSRVAGVSDEASWRSREHYVGYRYSPEVGIYAGLMDKVYGVRIIEHVAFSRSLPQVTQNDQTHGVAAHILKGDWEGGVHGFFGNLSQREELRMKGGSTMFERTVGGVHRLGASYMNAQNSFNRLQSAAVHARLNLKEGSSIISEFGQVEKKIFSTGESIKSRYGLLQTYLRPARGIYIFNNIEYAKANIDDDNYIVRWGPGVQIFPAQRIELRGDIYNTRSFGPSVSRPDNWTLLFQTHLWL